MKMRRSLVLGMALLLLVCAAPLGACRADAGAEDWLIGDPENPTVLTVFINHTWYPTDTFAGIIPEELTRRTGIVLEPVVASDYTQLGVLVASGELPDLVFTSKMLDVLSDPAVSYSYDELIATYGLDWAIDDRQINNAKVYSMDEHYYFLHSHEANDEDWQATSAVPMVATMLYRKDMLDALGVPEVKTLADLERVFALVKETWPDVIPLNFSVDTWVLNPLKTWNNCSLQYFELDEAGQCQIVAQTQPFYDYLKCCNEFYRKGYIRATNFAWVASDRNAEFCAGKAFATIGSTQYGPGSYSALLKTAPQAQVLEMAPLSDYKLNESDIGWSGTFITRSNRHPEESIRLMQYLFSEEGQRLTQWGREGIDYTLDERGMPVFSTEWTASIANDTNAAIYNPWFYFGGSTILEAEARCASEPASYQATNDAIRESYVNEPWYVYATPKAADEEYKLIYDKLDDLMRVGQARVILAADEAAFEASYAEFLQDLESIGVDKLAAYMTQKLADCMPLFQ